MFALGFFYDLQQLLAPFIGGAILSLFLSVLGFILVVGFVALGVFLAVLTAYTRWRRSRTCDDVQRGVLVRQILERPVPTTSRKQFADGVKAALDGFRFMNVQPWHQCWRFAIVPAVCNLLISAATIAAVIAVIVSYAGTVHAWFEPGGWSRLLEVITFVVLIAVTLAIGFGCWLFLQNVVCGHFFAKLTMRVERLLGTESTELQEQSLAADVTDAVRDTGLLLTVQSGLLLTNIVPGLGSVLSSVGGVYVGVMFAGAEIQSYPLLARAISRSDRKRFVRNHRWHVLGLGSTTLGLALLPGVGSMLLATSVVGGVLQYHRLTRV